MIRKILILLLTLGLLTLPVSAAIPTLEEVQAQLPEEASALLPETEAGLLPKLFQILQKALGTLLPQFRKTASICTAVLAASILCALFQQGNCSFPVGNLLGTAAIGGLLMGHTHLLIGSGLETTEAISDYGQLLLPVMSAALAGSGGPASASALYLGTALFDSVLLRWIARGIAPLLYLFLALALGSAALGSKTLERLETLLQKCMTWGLQGILLLFTGYMTLTGVISGTADAAAVKVTKLALGSAVPVVGGLLSNASETILAGASTVRSAAGTWGVLAVLAMTAGPFLSLAMQYGMLKLTAALCAVTGSEVQARLVEAFSNAMALILAMVSTGCLLQLISLACFLKGVG